MPCPGLPRPALPCPALPCSALPCPALAQRGSRSASLDGASWFPLRPLPPIRWPAGGGGSGVGRGMEIAWALIPNPGQNPPLPPPHTPGAAGSVPLGLGPEARRPDRPSYRLALGPPSGLRVPSPRSPPCRREKGVSGEGLMGVRNAPRGGGRRVPSDRTAQS